MQEITEDGKTFLVQGDYPNGRFSKQLKPKTAAPESKKQKAAKKIQDINWNNPTNKDIGNALRALLDIAGIETE